MKHINDETAIALRMRANWIETGDVCMSKADLVAVLEGSARLGDSPVRQKFQQMLIDASKLSFPQVALVNELREHAARVELDG